jgi:hypothetical protein
MLTAGGSVTKAAEAQGAVPFASATELRSAHAELLAELDRRLDEDASAQAEAAALDAMRVRIDQFLQRGVATGAYLEEIRQRSACQALLDYWVASASRGRRPAGAWRLAAFDGARLPDLRDKPCPYVGLEAFRAKEFFFGREADTQTLVRQLQGAPLVVVVGSSGSGKSSLVFGGVVPALREGPGTSFRIVPSFVPGSAPLEHLAAALLQALGRPPEGVREEAGRLRSDPARLRHLLGESKEDTPALIVIDQFEEVFTVSDPSEREALVNGLTELLADREAGHRVIVTMREEFRSRLVELRGLKPHLDGAWFSMRPLGYEELKAAVECPAALVNLQFQSGVVDDLVKKVLGQPAALPLLQFTLRALWENRDRNRVTREVYEKIGDPLRALQSAADKVVDSLAPETRDEVQRILLELVRVDDLLEVYRQPVRMSRLLQSGKANTDEVLELLVKHDFVRISAGTEADATVEVKHESLIRNWPRLISWIDDKRIQRRRRLVLIQAAQSWADSGKPGEGLLTGWQLQEATRQPDLSELEREFVNRSAAAIEIAHKQRENALRREADEALRLASQERALARRQRRLSFIFAGGLVAALLFASFLGLKYRGLRKQGQEQYEEQLRLRKQVVQLQRKDAEVLARQVGAQVLAPQVVGPADPQTFHRAKTPLTIFLHISLKDQRSRAQQIQEQLVKMGIKVPGIDFAKGPPVTQVRFFHESDREEAEKIASLLSQALDIGEARPERIRGYNNVPTRRFEVWFSPSAFGGAKASAL